MGDLWQTEQYFSLLQDPHIARIIVDQPGDLLVTGEQDPILRGL